MSGSSHFPCHGCWFVTLTLLILCCLTGYPAAELSSADIISQPESSGNSSVSAEWTVDFTASPIEGYPPLCVKFTVDGPLGEYFWDFGDGSTSMSRNPVHCYQRQGSYWVKMKYYVGQISGEVSKENFITVKDPMTFVDWKADPSNGTVPLTVRFSITGEPTNIIWDFDDGSDSTEFNPVHQYTRPGYYTPVLTYCLNGVCEKNSKYNYIEVHPGEEVNFTAERLDGIAPLSTKFVATGPAETWSWDFGDGTTSYEEDPGHIYSEPGIYTVTLTYSIEGATYSLTKTNYVTARSRITPTINASPQSGIAPLCVEFDMTNRPPSWLWYFGDNMTSPDDHAVHCYGTEGTYSVGLEYCSHDLCDMVTRENLITVQNPKIITIPGDDSATIRFSSDAGDSLEYFWSFGDMTSSEKAAPTHRYEEPGEYNVTLAVLGVCGCTATTNTTIRVDPKKPLDFSATPLQGCAPHCVQFSETSPAIPMTREWDFGDTEKSEDKNPFHCYQYPGVYSVSLKNEYPDGEQNVTKNDYITVYAVPRPLLAVNPPNGYAPLRITATDNTAGYESKRFWDFGDGTYESAARVEHEYDDEGVYNLSLTVWGEGDCHATVSQDIHVLKPEEVRYDLSGLPRRGSAPLCTSFQVKGSPYQWSIEFGDGQSSSSELNPFHCYESPGVYSPALHACDADGCEDVTKDGYVVVIPDEFRNLTLNEGWNLVSVPVSLEPGKDLASLFSSVDTAGHSLFSWDSAAGRWTRVFEDNQVSPLDAFWIYADKQVNIPLPISSQPPEGNLSRPLAAGWNLVSFPGVASIPAGEAFPKDLDWEYLIGFDAEHQKNHDPIERNDGSQMIDPRSGYWMYLSRPAMYYAPSL